MGVEDSNSSTSTEGYSAIPVSKQPTPNTSDSANETTLLTSSPPPSNPEVDLPPTEYYFGPDRMCRSCHDTEPIKDLIAPCYCRGSLQWVHRSCLNEWRAVSRNPDSFHRCDMCLRDYVIRRDDTGRTRSKIYIALLIIRDILALMLVIQAFLWLLTGLLALSGDSSYLRSVLNADSWSSVAVYYVGAILLALILVGLFSVCGACVYACGCHRSGCCAEMSHDQYRYSMVGYYYWLCCYCPPAPVVHHHHSSNVNYNSDIHISSHACDGLCIGCVNSGDCKDGKEVLAVIVIILIIIGIIVSVMFIVVAVVVIVTTHLKVLKKRDDAAEMIVVDLSQESIV